MRSPKSSVAISVIVAVGSRQADAAELYAEYKAGLDALDQDYELIFVLDGPQPRFAAALRELLARGEEFTMVSLTREFGDATALMAGFEQASGQTIVTLPAYHQVDVADLGKLVEATESNCVAIGWRWPRAGGVFERIRRSAFHGLVRPVHSPRTTTTSAAMPARSIVACWKRSSSTATSTASLRCWPTARDSG